MSGVLVIGKKGTLGSEFMRLYNKGEARGQAMGIDYSDVDITDEAAISAKIVELKPSVIINCAAYNAVDKAEEEPEVADKINGHAVGYIAKAAKGINAVVVHYSTNYVFDGTKQEGYNEDDKPSPQSAYGRSKLLGETELAKNAGRWYLIRTSWLYGQASGSSGSKKNFIDTMLELVRTKTDIECVTDQFGQPTWSRNLALATQELIASEAPSGIYHRTNAGNATWYSWAEEVFRIKNIKVNLAKNSFANFRRAGQRPQYGLLQNTKLPPLRPWQEALQDYLTNYQQ